MKIDSIKKIHEGKYLTYYVAHYILNDGSTKDYEFISRNKDLNIESFGKPISAGVGMVVYNEDHSKVLLQKEFRLACNNWVFNFPAGLIDEGENSFVAAKRELKEETGVDLISIEAILPPSYASQGTSDEAMEIIVCTASGTICESNHIEEEIEARWYSKEEVIQLLEQKEYMSVRTQMMLYMWINEK